MAKDYFRVKRFNEIYSNMKDYLIAHQDKVSDLNEGGAMSSQLEALSNELEEYYSRTKVGFIQFLLKLPYTIFGFTREKGTKAAGTVTFSTATGEPADGDVTIPEGTLVATDAGIQFETTESGLINSGSESSSPIATKAMEVGTEGNISAGAISTLITVIPQVETVNNLNPFTGGVDEETESEFKERFSEYINGLGRSNRHGIKYGAKTVEGVRSVGIVEHFPPKSDLYNLTLYIDDGSGTASSDIVASVKDRINGDGTAESPGYRPAGINIDYLSPTKVTVDVDVQVTTEETASPATIEYNIKNNATRYVNGLVIGQDFVRHDLTAAIMRINGVHNFTYNSPTGDIAVSQDQVARIGTITVGFN